MVAVKIDPQPVEVDSFYREAFQIKLGGVPRGAALVVSANANHDTVTVQNDLAEQGYESLVLRSCVCSLDADFVAGVDQVDAGLRHLSQRGWSGEQVGLIAYGDVGWLALHSAVSRELGAAVSLSPVLADSFSGQEAATVLAAAARLRTPWLALIAGSSHTVGAVDMALEDVFLDPTGNAYARAVSYRDVPQGFYEHTDDTPSYAAGFDAWQRTAEWLNQRVVPGSAPAINQTSDRR